jgi:ATP-dependent helicase Lhr and Lhr-like helicase
MSNVFDLLDPRIHALLSTRGISTPTEPQDKAIPEILQGHHVLLIAPTGLGKTEAALLPIFHEFLEDKKDTAKTRGISILYITPLRALNRDMLHRTFDWAKTLGMTIAVRHGDTPQAERAKQSQSPPDMLITTPETLQILFTGKRLRSHLRSVQWVIIDEVHELATDERGAQLTVALERLEEITTEHSFQRVGLSATVGLPQEVAHYLGGRTNTGFRPVTILEVDVTKHIDLKVEMPTITPADEALAHTLHIEPMSASLLRRCKELIESHVSTLLFINTRDGAEILASRFHQWDPDLNIGVHHGSLSRLARVEAEDAFKKGELKALICTSSLELGIDVGDTDFVIQYNSPREVTRIVQRVGRSGHRVGRTSQGAILATNPEDLTECLAIARRALAGELEKTPVRMNPLSVLTNQIISIVLEYGRIPERKAYEIITRSYSFHSLTYDLFVMLATQLRDSRTIWIDDEAGTRVFAKKMNSRHYFLDNISMIPDEVTYPVIDISTRKAIGTLDESFVLSAGFEGEKFILRGRPWIIVKREEDSILVAQVKEVGAVPNWVGEEIPIPYDVANEVGRLRRLAAGNQPITGYPCDPALLDTVRESVQTHQHLGFIVPDDTTITIDTEERTVVINACLGTKVNETLGRLISALLAQMLGESIGINSDAYRINLEIPARLPTDRIIEILRTTQPDTLPYLMETVLRNSTYLRWQLIHVARKFGALRKGFDYKNIGVKRLFSLFEHSLVLDEAMEKILWEHMDLPRTRHIIEQIQNGTITIHTHQGLSPLALAGCETIRGLMVPLRPDRSILLALKKRIEEADITMICLNCHHHWNTFVGRVPFQPKCPRCGAIKIAMVRRYHRDEAMVLTKHKRTTEDIKEIKRLNKNASLVLTYGKYAVLALAARGVGPDTAARILSRYSKLELKKSEELEVKFFRDILQAELTYARTRGFWD